MLKATILSAILLLILSGCGSERGYFYNANRTLEEARKDYNECVYDSAKAVAAAYGGPEVYRMTKLCMAAREYQCLRLREVPANVRTEVHGAYGIAAHNGDSH